MTFRSGRRGKSRAWLAIAAAVITLSTTATAAEPDPTPAPHPTPAPEPIHREHPWQMGLGLALGGCARHDMNVGGGGLCAELIPFSFDLRFARLWHFSAEIGLGYIPVGVAAYPDLHITAKSGGGYGAVRAMFGVDLSPRVFFSVGLQKRATVSLATVTPGVQGVIDIGTRIGEHWEVGMRGLVGADGVTTTQLDATSADTRWSGALTFGTQLITRVRFP